MALLKLIGHSGSGKTTLIEALIPLFKEIGWRVNVIKHGHHQPTWEPPHKDSARFRRAGAQEVLFSSGTAFALFHQAAADEAPLPLADLLARLAPAELTLIEGFKQEKLPTIEVYRPRLGVAPLYPHHPSVIALASDAPLETDLPQLPLNQPAAIMRFICDFVAKSTRPHS